MANILITGANGQLGTELRNRSFSLLDDVFYTDVEELDITNFKAICAFIETHDIDTIINCAAYTAVDQAEDDEEKAMKLNRDAVANLANAAVKLDCLLVHISTDYVFDGTSDHPYTEKDATNPQSVYGRTKLEGEQAIKKSGCLYIIIRTAWLYSGYGIKKEKAFRFLFFCSNSSEPCKAAFCKCLLILHLCRRSLPVLSVHRSVWRRIPEAAKSVHKAGS